MKTSRVLVLTLILLTMHCRFALAHGEWVHQYMVKQAYLLLEDEIGQPIPEMWNHLGFNTYGPGSGTWSSGNIAIGAWREDIDDPIWNVGGPNLGLECGFTASSTHFWNADGGDNTTINIPLDLNNCPAGGGEIPNAYQRTLLYGYGYWWLNYKPGTVFLALQAVTGHWLRFEPFIPELPMQIPFYYESLKDLFITNRMHVDYASPGQNYRTFDLTLNQYVAYQGRVYVTEQMKNEFVWEILGRMSHLLGDMSVPAHVHNDVHPCWVDILTVHVENGDSYELWASGAACCSDYNCNNPIGNIEAYNWTWQVASQQGNLVNVIGKENPLRYLSYSTNQIADHFGSLTTTSNSEFDIDWYPGDNAYDPNSGNDYYWQLASIMSSLGPPVTNQAEFQNSLVPTMNSAFLFSIRAIAGLLHWFAVDAGLITSTLVKNDFNDGQVIVNSQSYQSGTTFSFVNGASLTVSTTSPQTSGGYVRYFNEWQKLDENSQIISSYGEITWATVVDGNHAYNAEFDREFNVSLANAQFIEPGGSGGTYKVNGTDVGSTWQGTFLENSSPIVLEAVPPGGEWLFARWSDGNGQNPRSLAPGNHITLYATFKKHLLSTSTNVTAPNTQRKIIRDMDGNYHMVYESGDEIYKVNERRYNVGTRDWCREWRRLSTENTFDRRPEVPSFDTSCVRSLQHG